MPLGRGREGSKILNGFKIKFSPTMLNLQLLVVLACNSANKPPIQNPTKSPFAQCPKKAFLGF